jgi:hypothetical protein
MAGTVTIPRTNMTAGHGPYTFGPVDVADSDTGFIFDIDRDIPNGLNRNSASLSVEIRVEQSNDGGATWFLAVAADIPGGQYFSTGINGDGSLITFSGMTVDTYPGTARQARAIITVSTGSVAISGTLTIENTPRAAEPSQLALAFDAVGPSASGASSSGSTSLSWTHTAGAGATTAVVGASFDPTGADTGITLTAKYGVPSMTQIGASVHSNGQTAGYINAFGITGGATGAVTVAVTASTAAAFITGGSMSFTGAASFGTPATAQGSGTGNVTTLTVTVPSTTSGNQVVIFMVAGHSFTAVTAPGVKQFFAGTSSTNAAGFSAGGTNPSTGGSVGTTMTINGLDWMAAIAFEVIAGGGGPVGRPQKVRTVYGNPAHLVGTHQVTQLTNAAFR